MSQKVALERSKKTPYKAIRFAILMSTKGFFNRSIAEVFVATFPLCKGLQYLTKSRYDLFAFAQDKLPIIQLLTTQYKYMQVILC